MKSYQDIFDELESIRTKSSMEGTSLVILNRLLARSIYENEIFQISDVLENSFLRSTNLDNKLQHAFTRNYSVFRGKNQRIYFNQLVAITSINIKKFDVIMSFGNYDVLAAKDYSYDINEEDESNYNVFDIEGIITKKDAHGVIDFDINDGTLLMKTGVPNISEDIYIELFDGEKWVEAETYSDLMHYIGDANNKLLVQTTSNYSVNIMNLNLFNKKVGTKYSSNSSYSKLRLHYINYNPEDVDISEVTYLPKFDHTKKTNISRNQFSYRDENPLSIFTKTIDNFRNSLLIPNDDEFKEIIQEYFKDEIDCFKVIKDTGYQSTNEKELKDLLLVGRDGANIRFIKANLIETTGGTSSQYQSGTGANFGLLASNGSTHNNIPAIDAGNPFYYTYEADPSGSFIKVTDPDFGELYINKADYDIGDATGMTTYSRTFKYIKSHENYINWESPNDSYDKFMIYSADNWLDPIEVMDSIFYYNSYGFKVGEVSVTSLGTRYYYEEEIPYGMEYYENDEQVDNIEFFNFESGGSYLGNSRLLNKFINYYSNVTTSLNTYISSTIKAANIGDTLTNKDKVIFYTATTAPLSMNFQYQLYVLGEGTNNYKLVKDFKEEQSSNLYGFNGTANNYNLRYINNSKLHVFDFYNPKEYKTFDELTFDSTFEEVLDFNKDYLGTTSCVRLSNSTASKSIVLLVRKVSGSLSITYLGTSTSNSNTLRFNNVNYNLILNYPWSGGTSDQAIAKIKELKVSDWLDTNSTRLVFDDIYSSSITHRILSYNKNFMKVSTKRENTKNPTEVLVPYGYFNVTTTGEDKSCQFIFEKNTEANNEALEANYFKIVINLQRDTKVFTPVTGVLKDKLFRVAKVPYLDNRDFCLHTKKYNSYICRLKYIINGTAISDESGITFFNSEDRKTNSYCYIDNENGKITGLAALQYNVVSNNYDYTRTYSRFSASDNRIIIKYKSEEGLDPDHIAKFLEYFKNKYNNYYEISFDEFTSEDELKFTLNLNVSYTNDLVELKSSMNQVLEEYQLSLPELFNIDELISKFLKIKGVDSISYNGDYPLQFVDGYLNIELNCNYNKIMEE